MTQDQAKRIQRALAVHDDGIIGIGTLTALFRKFGAGPELSAELAVCADVHLRAAGVLDTPLRLAHFLAQVGHESGSFRYMEEIASGQAYEGRKDLGNVQPGDGKRYKGRGPIQITGRANYRRYGRILGIDIERHPEAASLPSIGFALACLYWTDRGLNVLSDADDLLGITRKVNGGTNGLDDRRSRLAAAKAVLL